MAVRVRVMVLALLVTVLALLAGCAQSKESATTGPCHPTRVDCPNELNAPLSRECGDAAHDPDCGAPYQSYFLCRQSNQICDGRGRLDEDASVALCAREHEAWTSCAVPVVDGGIDSSVDSGLDTFAPDTAVDSMSTDTRADTRADTKTD